MSEYRCSNLTLALLHRHLYGPPAAHCLLPIHWPHTYQPRDPVAAADRGRYVPPPHARPRDDTFTFTSQNDAWPFETPLPAGLPRLDRGYADRTVPTSALPLEAPRRLPDKRDFSTTDIPSTSPPYAVAEWITGRLIDVFA